LSESVDKYTAQNQDRFQFPTYSDFNVDMIKICRPPVPNVGLFYNA